MNKLIRKQLYKLILLFIVIIGILAVVSFFVFNSSEIIESFAQFEGMWSITIFILIRISITMAMTIFAFRQWFKQDDLHFSDIPLLFGLFFLGLVFGKSLDLLYKLTYFTADKDKLLILLKFRYIFIILTIAPLILIGIDIILFQLSLHYEKLSKDNYRNRLNLIIIVIIIVIESLIVILAPNLTGIIIILMCIHMPSLAWIVYTFYWAHRNKQLFQIKPLIVAIIFFIDLILYVLSIITNPFRKKIIGFSTSYIIFAELIDLIIIIVIFLGYYMESNYKTD